MNKPQAKKKILIVNPTLDIGGIEAFIVNLAEKIDKNICSIFFLTYSNKKFDYEDRVVRGGSIIFRKQDPKEINKIKHFRQLVVFLKDLKPDVVHSNTYFDSLYVILAAWYCSVPVRITHSHTARSKSVGVYKKLQHFIARPFINIFTTAKVACSKDAGEAMFGNKSFRILPNGVDEDRFIFSYKKRIEIRRKLGADKSTVVLGHVGRLNKVKNHNFILKLFNDFCSTKPNSLLLLIGEGPEKEEILKQAKILGIENKLFIFEKETDASSFYSAMDVFIFPSIYEGLPLALVEAQLNRLSILASSSISKEVRFSNKLKFIDLNNYSEWLNNLLKVEPRSNLKHVYRNETPFSINKSVTAVYDIYGIRGKYNEV